MQDPQLDPIRVFFATFTISSFAGLAALLRSGREINARTALSAMLNSGLMGLGIAFVWYNYLQDNLWFLMGVSLLAGLGGITVVDFVVQAMRNGGVNISLSTKKGGNDDDQDPQ